MASTVLSRTHAFRHPLASAVLTLPLTFPLLTPDQTSNSSHFTILDFPLGYPVARTVHTHISLSLPNSAIPSTGLFGYPLSHPVVPI